jgi:hypothetical protein
MQYYPNSELEEEIEISSRHQTVIPKPVRFRVELVFACYGRRASKHSFVLWAWHWFWH